jgi:hypothetical protein
MQQQQPNPFAFPRAPLQDITNQAPQQLQFPAAQPKFAMPSFSQQPAFVTAPTTTT